jgi:type VI protein secretion system component Hcp
MKKIFIFLWTFLSVITTLAQTNETEPNNGFTEANAVGFDTPIKGAIGVKGDEDFYKITLTKPSVVNISVEGLASNQYMYVEMFDSNQKSTGYSESGGNGKNVYHNQLQCSVGTYYIKLTTSFGTASATQYTMKITADITDIYECNNSFNDAKEVPLNTEIKASINSTGDEDFYKITLTKPSVVNVSVEGLASNQYMYVEMFDSNQKRTGYSESGGNGKNVYHNQLQCSIGTYYIKLTTSFGTPSSTQYTMKVNTDVTDIYECNNSFNDSKEIPLNTDIRASINSTGDEDFYKITLSKPSVVNISVEGVASNQYMYVEMFDPSQKRLGYSESGSNGKNVYYNQLQCSIGTYYIKLTTSFGTPSNTQYTMKVNADVTDIYECNNSFADAKVITLRTTVKAAINPDGDQDYYKFTLANKTTLNLILTEIPSGMTAYMDLYGQTQNFLVRGTNVTTTSSIKKAALEAGTYYVRIFASGFNPALYSLLVAPDTLLPPKISANKLSVCPGNDIILTATECTGIVKWSTTATGLSITVKPTVNTTYTATCEDGGKTSGVSQLLVITMNPIPNIVALASNGGDYYESQMINLSATGGISYKWSGPNNYASNQQNPQITNSKAGNSGIYSVTGANADGCTASNSVNVKVSILTAIEEEPNPSEIQVEVSPNPTQEVCNVKIDLLKPSKVALQLRDISGKSLQEQTLSNTNKHHETTLEFSNYPAGVYLLQVNVNDKRVVRKIIKQ